MSSVPNATVRLGHREIDLETGHVRGVADAVRLSPTERRLLRFLSERPGAAVTWDALASCWGATRPPSRRAVTVAVRRLRAKLEDDPQDPSHLFLVGTTGLRFETGEAKPATVRGAVVLRRGDLTLDLSAGFVSRRGVREALSATELELLRYLAAHDGAVVPADELLREVWGYRDGVQTRTLDMAVTRTRRKIEVDPANPRLLLRVPGRGLRLHLGGGNLAADPRPFFGRGHLVADLRARLEAGERCLCLLGPGGMGKSRLLGEVARLELAESAWDGGVWWCELASCRTGAEALGAIAGSLGISAPSTDALVQALATRGRTLLCLDTAEACADDLAGLGAVLAGAVDVVVLVVSRVRGQIPASAWVVVGPLSADAARDLFVAEATRHGRTVDGGTVDALVARVERLPLAIELAASQVSRLSLDPATLGNEALGVERSWELLDAEAQRALVVLAFFGRRFGLADAEAMLGEGAGEQVDVLLEHSLLHTVPDDGLGRTYAMLDLLREAAQGPWRARVDVPDDLERRYAERILALLAEIRPSSRAQTPAPRATVEAWPLARRACLLAHEHGLELIDVWIVLYEIFNAHDMEAVLSDVARLYWSLHQADTVASNTVAMGFAVLAPRHLDAVDLQTRLALCDVAAAYAVEAQDRFVDMRIRWTRVQLLRDMGRTADAVAAAEALRDHAAEIGHRGARAAAMRLLAICHPRSERADTLALLDEVIELVSRNYRPYLTAPYRLEAAALRRRLGMYDPAEAICRSLIRDTSGLGRAGVARLEMGRIHLDRGRLEHADTVFATCADEFGRHGQTAAASEAACGRARVALERGESGQVARNLQAARAWNRGRTLRVHRATTAVLEALGMHRDGHDEVALDLYEAVWPSLETLQADRERCVVAAAALLVDDDPVWRRRFEDASAHTALGRRVSALLRGRPRTPRSWEERLLTLLASGRSAPTARREGSTRTSSNESWRVEQGSAG
jgi:DNA-binding response OmpR family regulator/tetratricopeptide (TPR) repeat protein